MKYSDTIRYMSELYIGYVVAAITKYCIPGALSDSICSSNSGG